MKLLFAIFIVLACSSSALAESVSNALVGKWISDRESSLAYLDTLKTIPPKVREYCSGMWGNQIVEYRAKKYRAVNEKLEVNTNWLRYELIENTDSSLTYRDYESAGKPYNVTLYKEGDRYYVPVTIAGFKFRECCKKHAGVK